MESAAKRTASEALAQAMAITAMLVIAGFIFYPTKYSRTNQQQHSAFCRCSWDVDCWGTQDETG
jgi:hypothetical protein